MFKKQFWNGLKKMIPVSSFKLQNYMKKDIPLEVKVFELASLSLAAIMLKNEKKPLCIFYKCDKCPLTNKSKKGCLNQKEALTVHQRLFINMPITWQHLKAYEYGLKIVKPKKSK
jgi:hypothetical protein